MDRQIVYPGQVPLDTDLLNAQKSFMLGLGKLIAACLDTSTIVSGLAATPGGTGVSVQIGPGEIYALDNVDSTAFGSLAADTTHQVMKQGILLDAKSFTLAVPGTAGQSAKHLVEARFIDLDTGNALLPYYNSVNPSVIWSGPGNSGASQPTKRAGTLQLQVKAGTPATTGSQVTPTPDAGWIGLWVVTVPNGASSVNAGMISAYGSANFTGGAILTQFRNHLTASDPHTQYKRKTPNLDYYLAQL